MTDEQMMEELTQILGEQGANMVTSEEFLTGLGVIAGLLGVIMVIGAIVALINLICQWRIFSKAGDKGWKALIPVYNVYTEFKLVWNTKMFWIMLALNVVGAFLTTVAGEGALYAIGGIVYLAAAIMVLMEIHKLSVSFGHKIGFTLGLIFFGPIFRLILAFGKSTYVGPADQAMKQE